MQRNDDSGAASLGASPTLRGRTDEVGRIMAALADGHWVVSLSGPPGSGKSAICDELVRRLSGSGTAALLATSWSEAEAVDGSFGGVVIVDLPASALAPEEDNVRRWTAAHPTSRLLVSAVGVSMDAGSQTRLGPMASEVAREVLAETFRDRGPQTPPSSGLMEELLRDCDRTPGDLAALAVEARIASPPSLQSHHKPKQVARWDALGSAERGALARAGVFRTPVSAEWICQAVAMGCDEDDPRALVDRLLDADAIYVAEARRLCVYGVARRYLGGPAEPDAPVRALHAELFDDLARRAVELDRAGRSADAHALVDERGPDLIAALTHRVHREEETSILARGLTIALTRGRIAASLKAAVTGLPSSPELAGLRAVIAEQSVHASELITLLQSEEADDDLHPDWRTELVRARALYRVGRLQDAEDALDVLARGCADPVGRGQARCLLALLALSRGDLDSADREALAADAAYAERHDPSGVAAVLTVMAAIAARRGDHVGERSKLELALARFEEGNNLGGQTTTLMLLGRAALRRADLDEALGWLERHRPMAENLGRDAEIASCLRFRACALAEQGRLTEALDLLSQAGKIRPEDDVAGAARDVLTEMACLLAAGRAAEALSLAVRAAHLAGMAKSADESARIRAVAAVARHLATGSACAELLDAAAALSTEPTPEAQRLVGALHGLVAKRQVDEAQSSSWLVRVLGRVGPSGPQAASETAGIALAPSGSWVQVHDQDPVDLSAHKNQRRLLLALAAARVDRPGQIVAFHELLEAGWPGERIVPEAARNRVHVAIRALRKKALGPLLQTHEGGYRLDTDVPLHFRIEWPDDPVS